MEDLHFKVYSFNQEFDMKFDGALTFVFIIKFYHKQHLKNILYPSW